MADGIKGVVINRQWYEQATDMLPEPERRCAFYESVMRAAFGVEQSEPSDPIVRTMYKMVLPYVQADADKYARRCETNRENAQKKRMGANGSDWVRLGANGCEPAKVDGNNNINTNINTNTNTNTNLSPKERENKEKFDCMGIIFAKDAANVTEESKAFWNYYESLGWRNKAGAPVVNKAACARMWRIGGELAGQADWRNNWYQAFKSAATTSAIVWTQVKGLMLHPDGERAVLTIKTNGGAKWVDFIESVCTAQLRALLGIYNAHAIEYAY